MRVIALLSSYNEADVISSCLEHLFRHDIQAYLLDDGSTDETAIRAERYLRAGLIRIERVAGGEYSLTRILRRKEELAQELDADWFIHHDADEFREAPWPNVTLRDAIASVDRLGWNAIDFQVFNFPPVEAQEPAAFAPDHFPGFERGRSWDRLQVKCWKKTHNPVDLVASGGHDVFFDGRRVCPIRFVLRHYPIRSQQHGERKVFVERIPRYDTREQALGWHVQYSEAVRGQSFLKPVEQLRGFNHLDLAFELAAANRDLEQIEAARASLAGECGRLATELGEVESALSQALQSLADSKDARDALNVDLDDRNRRIADLEARLSQLLASKSWRLSAPFRALWGLLRLP